MKVEHVVKALSAFAANLDRKATQEYTREMAQFLSGHATELRHIVDKLKNGFRLDTNHVVVSRYVNKNGRDIVHAYGPFTREEAYRKRKAFLEEFPDGDVKLSVHKVIDVDGENLYHKIRGQQQ